MTDTTWTSKTMPNDANTDSLVATMINTEASLAANPDPAPEGGPSDEELCDLAAPYWDWDGEHTFFGSTAFARAVLARYSNRPAS